MGLAGRNSKQISLPAIYPYAKKACGWSLGRPNRKHEQHSGKLHVCHPFCMRAGIPPMRPPALPRRPAQPVSHHGMLAGGRPTCAPSPSLPARHRRPSVRQSMFTCAISEWSICLDLPLGVPEHYRSVHVECGHPVVKGVNHPERVNLGWLKRLITERKKMANISQGGHGESQFFESAVCGERSLRARQTPSWARSRRRA